MQSIILDPRPMTVTEVVIHCKPQTLVQSSKVASLDISNNDNLKILRLILHCQRKTMDISLFTILSVLLTQSACDVCVPEDIDSGRSDVCHGTAKYFTYSNEAQLVYVTAGYQKMGLTYAVEGLSTDDMTISCCASENTAIDHAGVKRLPHNSSHLHIYVPVVIKQYTESDHQQLNCTLWEMTINMPFPAEAIVTRYLLVLIMCNIGFTLGTHVLLHLGFPGAWILLVASVIALLILTCMYIYVKGSIILLTAILD